MVARMSVALAAVVLRSLALVRLFDALALVEGLPLALRYRGGVVP